MSEKSEEVTLRQVLVRGGLLVLAAVVGVVLIVVLALQDSDDVSTTETDDPNRSAVDGDEAGAVAICKNFVEDRLKSPASADFDLGEVRQLRGPVWEVVGEVDSENAFGAAIRNDYTCRVRFLGDDEWRLQKLAGLTN